MSRDLTFDGAFEHLYVMTQSTVSARRELGPGCWGGLGWGQGEPLVFGWLAPSIFAVTASQGSCGLLCPAPGLRVLSCSQGPLLRVVCAPRQVSALPTPDPFSNPTLSLLPSGLLHPCPAQDSLALDSQLLTPAPTLSLPWVSVPCQGTHSLVSWPP